MTEAGRKPAGGWEMAMSEGIVGGAVGARDTRACAALQRFAAAKSVWHGGHHGVGAVPRDFHGRNCGERISRMALLRTAERADWLGSAVIRTPPGIEIAQKIIGRGSRGDLGGNVGANSIAGRAIALAILDQPAGQHGRAVLLNPLVDQRGDILAQVGGVTQTG